MPITFVKRFCVDTAYLPQPNATLREWQGCAVCAPLMARPRFPARRHQCYNEPFPEKVSFRGCPILKP